MRESESIEDLEAQLDLAESELAALQCKLLPTTSLDAESADILTRAHVVARRLVEASADDAVLRIDEVDDATLVSFGFGLLVCKLTEVPLQPGLFKCGWCHAAAGSTDESWLALPSMPSAEVQEHTRACANNPVARERDAALRDASRVTADYGELYGQVATLVAAWDEWDAGGGRGVRLVDAAIDVLRRAVRQ